MFARLSLCLPLLVAAAASGQERPRNVIVMIADGSGYDTLAATRYWTGEPLAVDEGDWLRLSMSPYALRGGEETVDGFGSGDQVPDYEYDPARNYDARPVEGVEGVYPRGFAGYEWNREFRPDSANTMTSMMTGVVTYPGAINIGGDGEKLRSLAEAAKESGRRVGSVSSVPFNHATPASGAGAHATDRNFYHDIARELFASGTADVLGGPADPERDDDGRLRDEPLYDYMPADLWADLTSGIAETDGGERWTLVRDAHAIRDLAQGRTPSRLALIPRVARTLQQKRSSLGDDKTTSPGDDPLTSGLPSLTDIALAALNAVDDDEDGFFLMVEGGAADWAMHDNEFGRMIEEYEDFDAAVRAVVAALESGERGYSFDDTLLVVTADHDHLLCGPNAATVPFEPVQDRGPGVLPGYRWMSGHHSLRLVPFFARGAGAEGFVGLADEEDVVPIEAPRSVEGGGMYLRQWEMGRYLIDLVDGVPGEESDAPIEVINEAEPTTKPATRPA